MYKIGKRDFVCLLYQSSRVKLSVSVIETMQLMIFISGKMTTAFITILQSFLYEAPHILILVV